MWPTCEAPPRVLAPPRAHSRPQEAKGEIAYSASFVEWFAGEAKHGGGGDVIPAMRPDRRMLALKCPVGPAALLSVWNFPMAMLARKLAPALAAGCTVVARPDAVAPLSALALVQLAQEAGFPPGVINVVVGEARVARCCEPLLPP